VKFACHRAVEL